MAVGFLILCSLQILVIPDISYSERSEQFDKQNTDFDQIEFVDFEGEKQILLENGIIEEVKEDNFRKTRKGKKNKFTDSYDGNDQQARGTGDQHGKTVGEGEEDDEGRSKSITLSEQSNVVPTTGAFTFSIPINVPEGINGLTPKISLDYSSDGPENGLAGAGWRIGGVSYIERNGPPQELLHETVGVDPDPKVFRRYPPTCSSNDSFYLDGVRLVSCDDRPGNEAWCPKGQSAYVTLQNNFEKLVYTPTIWTRYRKDGTKDIYGLDRGSTCTGPHQEKYARFRISSTISVEERNNSSIENRIRYSYLTGSGSDEDLIQRIDYGGDPVLSWGVVFYWEDRPNGEKWEDFSAATRITRRKRLEKIEVWDGISTLIRRYQLQYEQSSETGASRLIRVTEYGHDGATSLPPYVFKYSDPSSSAEKGWSSTNDPDWTLPSASELNVIKFGRLEYDDFWSHNPNRGVVLTDLNADGFPDILKHSGTIRYRDPGPPDETTPITRVYLNDQQGGWYRADGTNGNPNWEGYINNAFIPHFVNDAGIAGLRAFDFNGDRYSDFLYLDHDADDGYTAGLFIYNPEYRMYDRIVGQNLETFLPGYNWQTGIPPFSFTLDPYVNRFSESDAGTRIVDVNGDGLADVIVARSFDYEKFEVYLNTSRSFELQTVDWQIPVIPAGQPGEGTRAKFVLNDFDYGSLLFGLRLGDVNGDGLPDMVQAMEWFYNGPSGNCDNIVTTPLATRYNVFVNNGHGWEYDISWTNSLRSLGGLRFTTGFQRESCYSPGSFFNHDEGLHLIDVNSDGRADLSYAYCNEGSCYRDARLNNGHGWGPTSHDWKVPNDGTQTQEFVRGQVSQYGFHISADRALRFLDYDSDGDLDMMLNRTLHEAQQYYLRPNRAIFNQDLMEELTLPEGGTISITYQNIKQSSDHPDLIGNKVVVSEITRTSATTVSATYPWNWSGTTKYSYRGGATIILEISLVDFV